MQEIFLQFGAVMSSETIEASQVDLTSSVHSYRRTPLTPPPPFSAVERQAYAPAIVRTASIRVSISASVLYMPMLTRTMAGAEKPGLSRSARISSSV